MCEAPGSIPSITHTENEKLNYKTTELEVSRTEGRECLLYMPGAVQVSPYYHGIQNEIRSQLLAIT